MEFQMFQVLSVKKDTCISNRTFHQEFVFQGKNDLKLILQNSLGNFLKFFLLHIQEFLRYCQRVVIFCVNQQENSHLIDWKL